VAQNHARPSCLGRRPHPQHLPPLAVFRLKGRRGPKKAILAIAASILTAAYYVLKDGATYHELGADYFERRDKPKSPAVSFGGSNNSVCPWRSAPLRNIGFVSF
jgi:hypothetical protein